VLCIELVESLLFMLFHGGFPPGDKGHDTPMWACILHCGTGQPTGDRACCRSPRLLGNQISACWQYRMSLATVDLNLPRSGLVQHMPGAVWHPVEGAGHFVAVGSADDVFAIAAEELGA
jgi:hypothetical protein